MPEITELYAKALLEYAKGDNLDELRRKALALILDNDAFDPGKAPEAMGALIEAAPGGKAEISAVLYEFLNLARKREDLLATEVVSAVPLTAEQLVKVEKKLEKILNKPLDITNTVDPSLLGGLRVIAGDEVLDDSIRRKLRAMKNGIYEGVYFKQ